MTTSTNNYDALEQLIFAEGLQIETIEIRRQTDSILITLNTKATLHQRLSLYPALLKAEESQVNNYQIIANGTGLHWPELDEDLSLKGLLQSELLSIVKKAA